MMKRIFMAGCMAVAVTLSVVAAPLASATESSAIASIPTGTIAYGIAASPDGSKVFVANYSDGTVSVISTATNTVIDTISIGGGAEPYVLAVSPDGSTLYVGRHRLGREHGDGHHYTHHIHGRWFILWHVRPRGVTRWQQAMGR